MGRLDELLRRRLVHAALEAPLREAIARGCAVLRSTRCLDGTVIDPAAPSSGDIPSAGALTPQQARVELIVRLMERSGGPG